MARCHSPGAQHPAMQGHHEENCDAAETCHPSFLAIQVSCTAAATSYPQVELSTDRRAGLFPSQNSDCKGRRRGVAGPVLRLVAEAGEEHLRLARRATDRPGQQVPDPLLQHRVGRQADGVADPLSFQQLVQLGLGERRVAAELERQAALTVAGDHRLQHRAPAFRAVHVAGAQERSARDRRNG